MDRRVTDMTGLSFLWTAKSSPLSAYEVPDLVVNTPHMRGTLTVACPRPFLSDGFVLVEGQWKVPVLLRTDVTFAIHRGTAHRASWASSGGNRCGVDAQGLRLGSGKTDIERRLHRFVILLQVECADHNPAGRLLEPELDPAQSKLMIGLFIELDGHVAGIEFGLIRGTLLENLFDRQSQGLKLLFLHPDDVRLVTDSDQHTESPLSGLSHRLNT